MYGRRPRPWARTDQDSGDGRMRSKPGERRPERGRGRRHGEDCHPMDALDRCAWGVRTTQHVHGVGIHVESAGPIRGPALFALHGFGSGTFTWCGLAPLLSDEIGFVAWDRPGFGRSDLPHPRTGAYGANAELARTDAIVGAHGARALPRVLVGHSAGCTEAVRAALDGAVAVDGLVLLAPAIGMGPPAAVRSLARLPGSGLAAVPALELAFRLSGPALRAGGRHRTDITDRTTAATAAVLRRPGMARVYWHLTRDLDADRGLLDRLGELSIPTLVIVGADDRIAPPSAAADVADRLGGERIVLRDIGHAPQEQGPDQVAALIAAFLAGLSPG